jgi:long-subunit fatty acid transport protein
MFSGKRYLFFIMMVIHMGWCTVAFSNYTHYKDVLIGGRAATMGGAYSAISDDASGVYYNPAGLVYNPHSMFTDSGNIFYHSKTVFEDVDGSYDWRLKSQGVKPNSFSLVNKVNGDFAWSVSSMVPYSYSEHQQELYDGKLNDSHREDTTTYIGPSLSYKVSDQLSIGMTLYYFSRTFREQYTQYGRNSGELTVAGISEPLYMNDYQLSVKGVLPIVGIMWSPMDKVSIASTIRQQVTLSSSVKGNRLTHVSGPTDINTINVVSLNNKQAGYPIQMGIGISYFVSPYFLISSDLDYYYQTDSQYEDVINVSIGTEYFITQAHAFRLGFFTNNTSSKQPTASSTAFRQHIDLMGITGGYTFYKGSTSLTAGVIYSFGKGKANVYSGNSQIYDYTRSDIAFIIAAGFGI